MRQRLAAFLRRDLRLELSADKTLITHGRTQKARFLGYHVIVQHSPSRPRVNGRIGLRVPAAWSRLSKPPTGATAPRGSGRTC